ncbi:MAG: hypothetical protein ABIJ59_20190 [Pseudomonadota bacterium]
MLKKSLFILLLFVFVGCQKESIEWNPIFEDTGFGYFHANIDRSLSLIDETFLKSDSGDQEAVRKNLYMIKQKLFEMKDYYFPLTTIRQKIYDAERFYKIKDIKNSEKLLKESSAILDTIGLKTKNSVFDKVTLDLKTMINKVILSLDDNSESKTYDNMRLLGEHINLMLFKGDLVLSEIEFDK